MGFFIIGLYFRTMKPWRKRNMRERENYYWQKKRRELLLWKKCLWYNWWWLFYMKPPPMTFSFWSIKLNVFISILLERKLEMENNKLWKKTCFLQWEWWVYIIPPPKTLSSSYKGNGHISINTIYLFLLITIYYLFSSATPMAMITCRLSKNFLKKKAWNH